MFYLFLGGAGAVAAVVCALLDLVVVKESFGNSLYEAGLSGAPLSKMVSYGMLAGLLCLVVGAPSLLFDLGRIDRAGCPDGVCRFFDDSPLCLPS